MSGLHEVLICAKDLHIRQMPEDYLIINLTRRLHARARRQPSNPYDSRAVLSLEGSYSDPRVRNALIIIVRHNRKQPSYGVLASECIRKMSSHTSWRKMMMKRLCYFPFYESAWFDLSWKCIYIWKKKAEPRWDQRSGRLPSPCSAVSRPLPYIWEVAFTYYYYARAFDVIYLERYWAILVIEFSNYDKRFAIDWALRRKWERR